MTEKPKTTDALAEFKIKRKEAEEQKRLKALLNKD